MRTRIVKTVAAFVICALAGVTALADSKGGKISFQEDFQLGGTQVEKGTYDVSFDKAAGELSIKKGSKVIAKAKARTEQGEKTNKYTTFRTTQEGGGNALRSVSFAGDKQMIVVGEGGASAGSAVSQ